MTAKQTIEKVLGEFLVKGKRYPNQLPPNLEEWHCYTRDDGHSILCLLEGLINPGELWRQLCPVPVKAVLRGWRSQDGFVVATTGFQYDDYTGLRVSDEDEEF